MDDKKISQLPETLSVGDNDYFVVVKEGTTKKAKRGNILSSYSLISETGNKIDLEINSQTYELVAKLYDKNNNLISTSRVIDLPIEQLVVSVSFDSATNELVITLKNGTSVRVPLSAIISGLATETYVDNAIKELDETLSSVAKSGSYNDLTNKPIIPSIEGLASETWVSNNFAPKNTTYTKTEVDNALGDKVDKEEGKSLVSDTDITQITTNKNNITNLQNTKAEKTALNYTNQKLYNIEQSLIGNTLSYVEDDDEAYSKDIPLPVSPATALLPNNIINSYGGKSVVENQLANQNSTQINIQTGVSIISGSVTLNNLEVSCNATISRDTSGLDLIRFGDSIKWISGHKYLFVTDKIIDTNKISINGFVAFCNRIENTIFTFNYAVASWWLNNLRLQALSDFIGEKSYDISFRHNVVDLTVYFNGNVPNITVEEMQQLYPELFVIRNKIDNTIKSAKVDKIVSVGRNIFNSILELNSYNTTTGEPMYQDKSIRCRDFIKVKPSTNYGLYIKNGVGSGASIGILFYDINKNYINSPLYQYGSYKVITTPSNAYYIKFRWYDTEWTPSEHLSEEICIYQTNDASGTYYQYKNIEKAIPQSVQQLDGYGMSAGNVYNEIDWENKKFIKRIGRVDLGTFTYVYDEPYKRFYTTALNNIILKPDSNAEPASVICEAFQSMSINYMFYNLGVDIGVGVAYTGAVSFRNLAYNNATDFKNAMNGVMFNYALATPEIIDISDILTDDELIELEAGGTLTFHQQDTQLPIPNTETFVYKLGGNE